MNNPKIYPDTPDTKEERLVYQNNSSSSFFKTLFLSKPSIPLFFLLLILIVLLVQKYLSKPESQPSETADVTQALPTQKIYRYFENDYDISIGVSKNELNIPERVSVYKIDNKGFSSDDISSILKNFNVGQTPRIIDDAVFGKTYFYTGGGNLFRIVPRFKIIDLKNKSSSDNVFISNPDENKVQEVALKYLTEKGFVKNTEDLFLYQVRFVNIDGAGHFTPGKEANMAIVSFARSIDGYPILSSTFETGTAKVTLNNKMEVVSLYFDDIPNISEKSDYPSKTYEEITREIKTSAVLQSVDNGKIELMEIDKKSIEKAVIENLEVVYIQENSSSSYLQPNYLLTGTIQIKNLGTKPASYIMSAVSAK